MPFTLIDLPFDTKALEPVMSAETLDFHHGKHHRAYVDKVNAMLAQGERSETSLVDLIRAAKGKDKKLFNNAAQIWNHNFFWLGLSGEGRQPEGKLKSMIVEGFGSTEHLVKALQDEATNHFSNGWAWLVLNGEKLEVTSLHDADTPVAHDGMTPLLTLDVWEHAYYIDYRNERPRYAESVLGKIVNWDFVARNLDGKGVERADQQPVEAREAEPA